MLEWKKSDKCEYNCQIYANWFGDHEQAKKQNWILISFSIDALGQHGSGRATPPAVNIHTVQTKSVKEKTKREHPHASQIWQAIYGKGPL